jgi:hypothetical protein
VHPEGGESPDLITPHDIVVHRGKELSLYVPMDNEGWMPIPSEPDGEMVADAAEGAMPSKAMAGPTITIDNTSDRAVVAFVEKDDMDWRLGTVPADSKEILALPDYISSGEQHEIDIFLHVEGGVDLSSQSFDVTPQSHLFVEYPPD